MKAGYKFCFEVLSGGISIGYLEKIDLHFYIIYLLNIHLIN